MKDCSSSATSRYVRTNDPEKPGYYFEYPRTTYWNPPVDTSDVDFLKTLLPKYIRQEYYSNGMLDSIENVYLDDLKRKEFFYDAVSNKTRFRFSGWYGKFAHIFVFTDFDSKNGFIQNAQQYFNLPELDKSKVTYDEEIVKDIGRCDFFYSYNDPKADFKLCAYPLLKREYIEGKFVYSYDYMILDLTVYPKEK